MTTLRLFILLGSIQALLGVLLGAFGAHALRHRLDAPMLEIWHTAVQYHLVHALGLLAIALAAGHWPESDILRRAGWSLFAGILLFSGSLYLLALTGMRWLGAVTPVGGLLFVIGWALLAFAAWRGFPA
ncbi:MAG: DUF423 domain-containing protein [Gammaproteobacteria bacterium]|jgi:uncharacterized membrane protein YgdD (TMEM256/DUF423 family)